MNVGHITLFKDQGAPQEVTGTGNLFAMMREVACTALTVFAYACIQNFNLQ